MSLLSSFTRPTEHEGSLAHWFARLLYYQPALLLYLRDLGLSGLECRYSTHTEEQADRLEAIASRLGLTVTAGSDFHGPEMDEILDIGITRLPPSRSSR